MTGTVIQFPLPEWVRLIPIGDVDTAEQTLVTLIADSQHDGQVGMAQYESAAIDVVGGAMEQGIWALGLATPPGRPAALLSVTGFRVPVTLDRHATTDLLSYLEDQGGPGIVGLHFAELGYGQTALLLHRTDISGSQAQAFVPDAAGQGCFLLTLAAQQQDRGPELLELVRDIVIAAMPQATMPLLSRDSVA
jgi:hypothetical protein